jgi:hypothetical protein
VAKKNTEGTAPTARRATTRRTTSTPAGSADRIDSAADMSGGPAAARRPQQQPTYDDIAQKAYERYLERGRSDGQDFDDWIEAERELATRNGS